ncbi:MAG: NADH-quinone oxidoreductase subunit L [Bacteroidetes bacterium]|nr:NADH-quinone oxidoreductase subunit L [Bacteroidota bacterium]
MNLALLIPVLPLIGFIINGLFGKNLSKSSVGLIGSGAILGAFICTVVVFVSFVSGGSAATTVKAFDWLVIGDTTLSFSFFVDQLSLIMMSLVTGVGFLIHVYSVGYMHDDENYNRFFAYLNLFVFFMLLLVMGDNYLVLFTGWEGVGFCSYLLIGFWYKTPDYNDAAKKAFIMNRIGDLGFILGLFVMFSEFGSLQFTEVFADAAQYSEGNPAILGITILLFIGATGKSAQLPLFTWLPDAMAGPTPVSALIHAATMVTAGIYLIVRSHILFNLAPETMCIIAWVGAITALVAATIAVVQNDIKKVLAYSTVSQLGMIFIALGVGAYTSSMFHLLTHAFFKALLFLGAGSVIHAMSGEQDIRKMGGLKKALPLTHITFVIGCIAIAGIPPFSGFFSKDEMLAHIFNDSPALWVVASATSALTAFYMFRLYFLTFSNGFRGTDHQKHHLHESPSSMTTPLVVLAVLAAFGGVLGLPLELFGLEHGHFLQNFLGLEDSSFDLSHETEIFLMLGAVALAVASWLLAKRIYKEKQTLPAENVTGIQKLFVGKYFLDEVYEKVIIRPFQLLGNALYIFIEERVIDPVVNAFGTLSVKKGNFVKQLQQGNTGFYIFGIVAGVVLILVANLIWFR